MANIVRRVASKVKYKLINEHNKLRIIISRKKISEFKNAYDGKRCFIIGNGPSLTVDDLKKLKNEISFGSNRVYQIFDKTEWRPTFYCIQDYKLICKSYEEINTVKAKEKFVGVVPQYRYKAFSNANYIKLNTAPFYPDLPEFSDNIEKEIFEGYTVTYMCLQIAVYMGFKEICLLGIDHNYSVDLNPDGTIKKTEGISDHFSENDKIDNLPQTYKSTLAYHAAKKYADNHNLRIYNCTRGGKLEVFERKKLEEVLEK